MQRPLPRRCGCVPRRQSSTPHPRGRGGPRPPPRCARSGRPDLVGAGSKADAPSGGYLAVLLHLGGGPCPLTPARQVDVIDPPGASDALSAAVIFGLLNEIPLDESVRLGVSASAVTLRTRGSVAPSISLELLCEQAR